MVLNYRGKARLKVLALASFRNGSSPGAAAPTGGTSQVGSDRQRCRPPAMRFEAKGLP